MARHATRRDRSDTPQRKAALLAMMQESIALPTGCAFASDEEKTLWAIYTQARVPDDWRCLDLLNLFKVVQMETQIREQSRLLEVEGYMQGAAGGKLVKNPRLGVVRSLQMLQLQLLRVLKIHAIPDTPSNMASRARDASRLSSAAKQEDDNLLSGRTV
ncbi:hypothetical protein [Aquipseudomonas ullengensis]|uniref:Phage terminase, small subunit, putative, P27 family n=1 Tax=Aquipseudomonas ullengensis TaxID=2759166 RepID=A0A7W4LPA6_9GAMM|nr:hypothetical protein [Pseudomonas ullengensis]MBB2496839.1 hypothetical protein [Pseudomonas ullengensis]